MFQLFNVQELLKMPKIVNLSTLHDYSIDHTMSAFLTICNQYSPNLPRFFATQYNNVWLRIQFYRFYASHIEPYKLGKIDTNKFYDNLAEVLGFFPEDMDKTTRNEQLAKAWNASITVSEKTHGRLLKLAEQATKEDPVFLISNTNELNAIAVLAAFKNSYPSLAFMENIDLSIKESKEPVEILPNVFLCLSYRYQMFKTNNMLRDIVESQPSGAAFTVVSQWDEDRKTAVSLNIEQVYSDTDYFDVVAPVKQI